MKRKGGLSPRDRRELFRAVRGVRAAERGKPKGLYNNERLISSVPYFGDFLHQLNKKLSSRKTKAPVAIYEKGAGKHLAGDIKRIVHEFAETGAVHITTVSVTNSYTEQMKRHIDVPLVGVGLTMRHKRKFDFIFDAYDEDYHLPKSLIAKSLRKSVSDLAEGGQLFTIIPLVHLPSKQQFTVHEGEQLIKRLAEKMPGVSIKTKPIHRRFDKREYVDFVVHITKNS